MGRLVRAVVAALVICTALSVASAPALASGEETTTNLGTIDVTIQDEQVRVSDVELEGEGLPAMEIDEREFTIDAASVQIDGLTVDYDGTTYEIAGVHLEIRDVGVTLEDVSVGTAG